MTTVDEKEPPTLGVALGHLAVSLGSWVASIGVSYLLIRVISQPDFGRTVVMRGARTSEAFCMDRAKTWADRAARCSTVYESARTVVL